MQWKFQFIGFRYGKFVCGFQITAVRQSVNCDPVKFNLLQNIISSPSFFVNKQNWIAMISLLFSACSVGWSLRRTYFCTVTFTATVVRTMSSCTAVPPEATLH